MAEHELNKIVDDAGETFNLRDATKQPVADRVTAWGSTPSDTKYPSEKLVKTALDGKESLFDSLYVRFDAIGNGWVKLAEIGEKKRVSVDINCVWDVVLARANGGLWNEKLVLSVRYQNEPGSVPELKKFNRYVESDISEYFKFTVKVSGVSNQGTTNVELWGYVPKGWNTIGIREAGAGSSSLSSSKYWIYYSYNTEGGGDKPVADSSSNIQVFDPTQYVGLSTLDTLPIANGGTGATTKKAAEYAINGGMAQATAAMADNFQIVFSRVGSDQSATNGVFIYRTALTVWNYIKDKISSVLGLTATDYGGNAATATTATTAAGYTSGGAIDTALQGKAASDSVVAIADAFVRRGSTDYLSNWMKVAETTFTSASNTFCSSWLVTITSRNNGSRTESFFLNFALQAGTSGTAAPSACNFYTSPIKSNANNTRAFKAVVTGSSGNYTIKIYYTAGGMDRSGMTMKELGAHAAYSNSSSKSAWKYYNYSASDEGDATEPTGDYNYACEWNYMAQADWNQSTDTADDYIKNKPWLSKYSGGSSIIYEVCTLPKSSNAVRGYGFEFKVRQGDAVVEGKLLGRNGVEIYQKKQGSPSTTGNVLKWYAYDYSDGSSTYTKIYASSAAYVELSIVLLNNHSNFDISSFGATVSEIPSGATEITPRWEASCTASSNGNPVAVNEFGEMSIASAVRYDTNAQGLTDTQKLNARTNIGISNSDTVFIYPIDTTEPNVWPKFLAAYNAGKQMFATYWEGVAQGVARKRILPLVGVTTETTNNTPTSFTFGMPYGEDTDSNFGRLVRWTLGISTGWVLSELDVTYAATAGLATKATKDGSGNEIESSYKKKTYADAFTTSQQIAVSNATYAYWYIGNSYKRIRVGVSGNGNVSIGEETGKSASPTSATDIIKSSGTGDATTYNFYGKASDSTKWDGYSIVVGSVGTDANTIYFL